MAVQTLRWITRPIPFMEQCRRRYGDRFTVSLPVARTLVFLSEPDQVRQVFTAPADVLHAGEGMELLEPMLGRRSILLLDGREHLQQRRLMLPAFHGDRMRRLTGLMIEVAEREVAAWPREQPLSLHPRMQHLTLEIILRAVFGLDEGGRLDGLRRGLTEALELSASSLAVVPAARRELGGLSPFARLRRVLERTDALIYELIAERHAQERTQEREDVLAMLVCARDADGRPLSDVELRDELMTLLVAGHETTASALAWCFEQLTRAPAALGDLQRAVDAGEDDAELEATVQETLRRRPVLPIAMPRRVMEPLEVGGVLYPAGVFLAPCIYLVHHRPELYPQPYAFRPRRFIDEPPGTYTWIPFGGGVRRCLGASFATLEMKVVLRAVLAGAEVRVADGRREGTRRRNITLSPRRGARVVVGAQRARTPRRPAPVAV